jgi:cytochrome oxidase assembly protein ShyY1
VSRYGFLSQPRWLALGFLVLIVVPSFFLLSRWQLSRLDDRRAENTLVTTNSAAAAVPVDAVLTPGADPAAVPEELRWRPVTATGRYDAAGEVLVRKRPLEGTNGFWVVTPLVTGSGAVLAVNRGWVATTGGADATQAVPPAPSGEVEVVGRIQLSQDAPIPQPEDLPAGQITDLSVPLVADGATAYPAYIELVSSTPAQEPGLRPLPLPDLSDGPHLSYAVQWVFFAAVAVTGFVILVRREREYADQGTQVAPTEPSDVA